MLETLMHPKVFNVVIMALYCLATVWWAWHRSYVDSLYWLFALGITATVTFGYQR
jgi:DNA-binding transcriptional regulator of glucitol operon